MAEKRVLVKVIGVYVHQEGDDAALHFVLFRDEAKRRIPMFLGQCEAWAISLGLEDKAPARPFTFEAWLTCLSLAGATVEEVYINDMREETFYAMVRLRVGDQVHSLDMRPSDAVNLAIRVNCPILMNDAVIESVLEDRRSAAG